MLQHWHTDIYLQLTANRGNFWAEIEFQVNKFSFLFAHWLCQSSFGLIVQDRPQATADEVAVTLISAGVEMNEKYTSHLQQFICSVCQLCNISARLCVEIWHNTLRNHGRVSQYCLGVVDLNKYVLSTANRIPRKSWRKCSEFIFIALPDILLLGRRVFRE